MAFSNGSSCQSGNWFYIGPLAGLCQLFTDLLSGNTNLIITKWLWITAARGTLPCWSVASCWYRISRWSVVPCTCGLAWATARWTARASRSSRTDDSSNWCRLSWPRTPSHTWLPDTAAVSDSTSNVPTLKGQCQHSKGTCSPVLTWCILCAPDRVDSGRTEWSWTSVARQAG